MKTKIKFPFILLIAFLLINYSSYSQQNTKAKADPLPSWNAGNVKKSIIDFVTKTTKEGSGSAFAFVFCWE